MTDFNSIKLSEIQNGRELVITSKQGMTRLFVDLSSRTAQYVVTQVAGIKFSYNNLPRIDRRSISPVINIGGNAFLKIAGNKINLSSISKISVIEV